MGHYGSPVCILFHSNPYYVHNQLVAIVTNREITHFTSISCAYLLEWDPFLRDPLPYSKGTS